MDTRQDFMAVRRAATLMSHATDPSELATAVLLRHASVDELTFIRLGNAGVQSAVVDLAWAVLGESRPGGAAIVPPSKCNYPRCGCVGGPCD